MRGPLSGAQECRRARAKVMTSTTHPTNNKPSRADQYKHLAIAKVVAGVIASNLKKFP